MTKRFDLLTVAGLAAGAYVVTTLLHEGLGHGGGCLLVGARPIDWGAYYFDCNTDGLSDWTFRVVAAAGNTVNLIVAVITGLWLKMRLKDPQKPRGAGTIFIWLMFALNAFTWAGYFLFSGVAGIGDWGVGSSAVLYDVPNPGVWRIVMAVFGGGAYFLLGRAAGRMLGVIVGGDRQAGRKLAFTAYFTGGILACLTGFLNPMGFIIVLISAAASSLGGTSGLLWQHMFIKVEPASSFTLDRSWLWIATGVVAAVAYAIVLGPSVKL